MPVNRTALVVHVESFGIGFDPDGEPLLSALHPLPCSAEAKALRDVLADFGYTLREADDSTGEEIGDAVQQVINQHGPDDCVIVHLLSHGVSDPNTSGLYVLGRDGECSSRANVVDWLNKIHATADGYRPDQRPHVLFLLDICHGGKAITETWSFDNAHRPGKVWVLAATNADWMAYNARFTRAMTEVLEAARDGDAELDLSSAKPYVSLEKIARHVGRRIEAQAEADQVGPQRPIHTPFLGLTDPEDLPFFEMSRTAVHIGPAGPRPTVSSALDQLDEALDATHFVSAASGGAVLEADEDPRVRGGCYYGRSAELAALTEWLDRPGPGNLRVITGRPGVGKSALVGVLVCRAHPALREPTEGLFKLPRAPRLHPELVAVHARERSLGDLTAALDRQLFGPGAVRPPHELVRAVAVDKRAPLIVIDALDEALDPAGVVKDLLHPLRTARRADQRPACRLVVGTRTGEAVRSLLDTAEADNGLIDLDTVPTQVLRNELTMYVLQLVMWGAPDRYEVAPRAWMSFSAAVASALTRNRGEWGEFLIAGLYTRHVLEATGPTTSSEDIERRGAAVPNDLFRILDIDLALRSRAHPWVRPVLGTLARAHGEGMPAEVVWSVAASRAAAATPPGGVRAVARALREVGFYLRRSADPDGAILYRLFHEGLARYLRENADPATTAPTAPAMFEGVLAAVPRVQGDRRAWRLAPPYVRRHIVDHARDAGAVGRLLHDAEFALHAPVSTLEKAAEIGEAAASGDRPPTVTDPDMAAARAIRAIARIRRDAPDADTHRCRASLSIEAMRHGAADLSHGISHPADGPVPLWWPRWVTGAVVSADEREPATADTQPPACAVLVADGGRTIKSYDLRTGRPLRSTHPPHLSPVRTIAVARGAGQSVIVTGGDDHTLRLSTSSGAERPRVLGNFRAPVRAACTVSCRGVQVVIGGSDDGSIRLWTLDDQLLGTVDCGEPIRQLGATVVGGRIMAATVGSRGIVTMWDLTNSGRVGSLASADTGRRPTITVVNHEGVAAVVTAGEGGAAGAWRLTNGDHIATFRHGLSEPATGLVAAVVGERVLAVVAIGRQLVRWDALSQTPSAEPFATTESRILSLTSADIAGRPAILAGCDDGALYGWNLDDRTLTTRVTLDRRVQRLALIALDDRRPGSAPVSGERKASNRQPVTCGAETTARPVKPVASTVPPGSVAAVAAMVHQDVLIVAAGDNSGRVRLAQATPATQGPLAQRSLCNPNGAVASLALHSVARQAVLSVMDADGMVTVWDAVGGNPYPAGPHIARWQQVAGWPAADTSSGPDNVALAFQHGRLVVVEAKVDGGLAVHGADDGRVLRLPGHDGRITAMRALPGTSRSLVVSGGVDGTVRLWEITEGRELERFNLLSPVRELLVLCSGRDGTGWVVARTGGEALVFEYSIPEG